MKMENNKDNIGFQTLIEREIEILTKELYLIHSSDSGYLFGIPPKYKDGVKNVVKAFYDLYLQKILND